MFHVLFRLASRRYGLFLDTLLVTLLGLGSSSISVPSPASSPASLIYAGWFGSTTPTPDYIRDHQAFLEGQPFSGLVIYLRDPGLTLNVSTQVMTNTPVSYAAISSVLAPLRGLSFTTLTQNFGLVFGSAPPDFFADWSVTIQNFANLASAVKDAGLKGIFFDNEQYFAPWGDYPTGVLYPVKSLGEYRDQARWRGRQVMEAMVAQFPEIVVLTLHGPYISEPQAPAPLFPQWSSGNELLGPFFVGFMEGRGSQAQNADGGELYALRSSEEFLEAYEWRKNTFASDSVNCAFLPAADRLSWPSQSSISFGVYDQPFGGADMNVSIVKTTLTRALRQSDRWVWFYVEGPTFLKPESQGGANQVWIDAVRQAREDAAPTEPEATPPPDDTAPPTAPSGPDPSPVSSSRSASRCAFLGGEATLLILMLGWYRRRSPWQPGLPRKNRPTGS